jgi:tetratricopeptide (TPR) repeat protein
MRAFPSIAASFPDYAPVFVDDASVLYASSSQNPDLVERHRLRAIDPFALSPVGSPGDPETPARAAAELRRINEIFPNAGSTGVFEIELALERGDTDTALRRADELLRVHGDLPESYRLRADALFRLRRFGDAVEAYRVAIARLGDDPSSRAQRAYLEARQWACLLELGDFERAYRAARNALPDIYAPGVGYSELVALGRVALQSGHDQEGRRLLEFALQKTPSHETQLRAWIQQQLSAAAR